MHGVSLTKPTPNHLDFSRSLEEAVYTDYFKCPSTGSCSSTNPDVSYHQGFIYELNLRGEGGGGGGV